MVLYFLEQRGMPLHLEVAWQPRDRSFYAKLLMLIRTKKCGYSLKLPMQKQQRHINVGML